WQNLGFDPVAIGASTVCTSDSLPCTFSFGGYTITVTNPYSSVPNVGTYVAAQAVSVDITHDRALALAGIFGTSTVTIKAHAAAYAPFTNQVFPFALATRLLHIHGGSTATAYGTILIGECSHGGDGGFTPGGGAGFNGG